MWKQIMSNVYHVSYLRHAMICDANVMLMNVVLNSNSSKQEEREQIV